MLAAVIVEPRVIRLEQVEIPRPGSHDALIRTEGCGVCASNLPLWQGRPWFNYPLAPGQGGHEAWGRVQAVGRDVRDLATGDRVAFLSNNAYAEYDIAPSSAVVKLPPALEGKPFPGEPLSCAINVFRRSDIRPGQTVAIVGVGFLGALLTRLAVNARARVIGVSRRAFSLRVARDFGASEVLAMDNPAKTIQRVRELTDERGCDCVIEAVGIQSSLDLATELTSERGKLVIAGYHQDGPRQVNMQLWNWRGLDVINAHERDPRVYVEGMQLAAQAVADGKLDPSPLYSEFSLAQLGDAFERIESRPDGFVKALVIP